MASVLRVLIMAIFPVIAATTSVGAEELPVVKVWKNPSCGCCGKWVEHMRKAGFRVEVTAVQNLTPIKRMAGIPENLESCHTAVVGGYRIEGHVPADDVKRLLKTKPEIDGLSVPGMPVGSPGMEGGTPEPYEVLGFKRSGETVVFARH